MEINSRKFNIGIFKEFSLFLVVFLSIFLSGTFKISNKGLMNSSFVRILYLILPILLFLLSIQKLYPILIIHKKSIIPISFCIVFIVVNIYRSPSNIFHLFIRVLWFFSFFNFFRYGNSLCKDFFFYFDNIIKSLSVITIIIFVLINILDVYLPLQTIRFNQTNYFCFAHIYYLIPSSKTIFLGRNIYRAQSIFWEPGVFSVYLTFDLFFNLFFKNKLKLTSILILVIGVFITFSTTGICLSIVLLVCYLMTNKKFSRNLKIFAVILIAPIAFSFLVKTWLNKKYSSGNEISGSYSLRKVDLEYGFSLFLQNPLLGTGYNNDKAYINFFKKTFRYERGSSNGLMTWIYTTGILGVFLIIFPFIINIYKSKKKFIKLLYFASFLILNMTEPLFLTPFIIFLVAKEYSEIYQEKIL